MAGVVVGLMRFGGFGEEEGTPVCDSSDYAARAEDQGAGVAGDSGQGVVLLVRWVLFW